MHPETKKHLEKSLERVEAAFSKPKHPDHDARKQKLLERIEKNSAAFPAESLPVLYEKIEEFFALARGDDALAAMEAFTDACDLAHKALGR